MNEFNPDSPEQGEQSPFERSKENVRSQENQDMIPMLDQDGFSVLNMTEPELRHPDGKDPEKYYGETRRDDDEDMQYDKRVRYTEEQDQETKTVYASSEQVAQCDDKGRTITVKGQNLDMKYPGHMWEASFEYDEKTGEKTLEKGSTTGGENEGASYEKRFETDQHGEFTRKSEINTIKKYEGTGADRKLVTTINIKREHFNADGKKIFGYQQDKGNPVSLMMWDKYGKTENIPDGISIEVN